MSSKLAPATDRQKEWCAVSTMNTMLVRLAADRGISYEEALSDFAESPVYEALFNYGTGLWMEGPDYLEDAFLKHPIR